MNGSFSQNGKRKEAHANRSMTSSPGSLSRKFIAGWLLFIDNGSHCRSAGTVGQHPCSLLVTRGQDGRSPPAVYHSQRHTIFEELSSPSLSPYLCVSKTRLYIGLSGRIRENWEKRVRLKKAFRPGESLRVSENSSHTLSL